MTDRPFSHPNFGRQVKIEQKGKRVILTLESNSVEQARSLADTLLEQLKAGGIHMTLMGKPSKIEHEP